MDQFVEFAVKFKKKDATLRLTRSRIYCTFDGIKTPSVTILGNEIKS